MPVLSRAKKSVGNALSSAAMKADARQTDLCVYLSAILLVGLVLNATLEVVVGPSGSVTGYGSTHWGGRIRGRKSEGLLVVHSAAAEIIPQSGVPAEVAWLGGGAHLGKGNGKTKQFGWLQDLCNQKLFCPNRFRRPCNHPN